MKKTFTSLLLCSLLYFAASAQSSTPNTTLSEKDQKEVLKLNKRLSERRLELIKLQGKLDDANRKVEKTENEAKESARVNAKAAEKLNDDALDKKKAKQARKKASAAATDAKNARKAAKDLEDLKANIHALQKKITKDSTSLQKLNGAPQ